jgi:hypothetical protein
MSLEQRKRLGFVHVFHTVEAMNKRHHWWDGHAGRMARRDIIVYEDGARWLVEARQGGSEGTSRRREVRGDFFRWPPSSPATRLNPPRQMSKPSNFFNRN